jgi:3-methyladenine DNA glycosylase AlkD
MQEELLTLFYKQKNPEQARAMENYMKDNFPFLGIKKPARAALQSDFLKQTKKSSSIDWALVYMLWNLPEREFQYFALDYLLNLKKLLQTEDITKLEVLITKKPWWDTIDLIATLVGLLCTKYPELIKSHILGWSKDQDIWLVRTTILFQLKYKDKTNTELLSTIINHNCDTKEFFINKAIGWVLREYSKTNPEWVRQFLESTPLHPLSVREGSKYLG